MQGEHDGARVLTPEGYADRVTLGFVPAAFRIVDPGLDPAAPLQLVAELRGDVEGGTLRRSQPLEVEDEPPAIGELAVAAEMNQGDEADICVLGERASLLQGDTGVADEGRATDSPRR